MLYKYHSWLIPSSFFPFCDGIKQRIGQGYYGYFPGSILWVYFKYQNLIYSLVKAFKTRQDKMPTCLEDVIIPPDKIGADLPAAEARHSAANGARPTPVSPRRP